MSLYGERCGALSVVCADAARGRSTCSASSSSRCGATTRARRSTAARSSPRVLGEPALRSAVGSRARRRCASASWRCARRCTRSCRAKMPGRDFGYFLTPARHVQLHRPVAARRSTGCARSSRVYLRALGADVRRRPEHAATSRPTALAMAAVLDAARPSVERAQRRPASDAPCRSAARMQRQPGGDAGEAVAAHRPRRGKRRCSRSVSRRRPVEPPVK